MSRVATLTSDRGLFLVALGGGTLCGLLPLNDRLQIAPLRALLLLAAGAAAIVAARGLTQANKAPLLRTAGALVAAIAMAGAIQLTGERTSLYDLARAVPGPLIAWSVVTFGMLDARRSSARAVAAAESPSVGGGYVVALLAFAAMCGAFIVHEIEWPWLGGGIDDNLYVMQGQLLRGGRVSAVVDPLLLPFVQLRQTAVVDGRFFTEYPPGWPALLAMGSFLNIATVLPMLLTGVNVFLVGRIGARVFGRGAGVAAAALFAVHPWILRMGSTPLSHAATMTAMLVAADLLIEAPGESRFDYPRAVGAGLALGIGVMIRPLTGVGIGASLMLWRALRSRQSARARWAHAALVALGGLGPTLLLLYYNRATTGDALRFGYAAANGTLHDLGFGIRGMITRHVGSPVAWTMNFTPAVALRAFALRSGELLSEGLLPASLTIVIIGLLAPEAVRQRRLPVLLAFAVMPALYAVYFWSSARFYLDLVPFLCIGVAGMVYEQFASEPGRRFYISVLLVSALATANIPIVLGVAHLRSPRIAARRELLLLHQRYPHLLVFVREPVGPKGEEELLESLQPPFVPSLDSSLVVARDLGVKDDSLRARLPDYHAMVADWPGRDLPVRWHALEPSDSLALRRSLR